ncbi:hypothetical protein BJY00DRAFT_294449 [Aspergillus carlsbadensis]|nr:hypothetical protein BJY00DRAFT_294449 [Aspergillus carlsbadensis]
MSVAFAQQGTVDWTSLGRMQFSASIAVLSRLSSAGLESLTVAFGQAMCTRIPLGPHGEKFLMESLNKLQAFSTFGDLVWFGVGVRHVLRDVVQTAEGASLVALCAALGETYTNSVAALILYEMAKELKAPTELSPSITQWEALVATSSCTFRETTFSLRIEKLLKLAGLSGPSFPRDTGGAWSHPGHPQDIARCIVALGDIMRGTVEQITIHGGPASCWLATYASLILGLRVRLARNGEPLFANYDERQANAQLCIEVLDGSAMTNTLSHVGTTFTLRGGRDFIKQVFGGFDQLRFGIDAEPLVGGTVPWETLIVDTFEPHGQKVLEQLHLASTTASRDVDELVRQTPYRVLYQASIMLFISSQGLTVDDKTLSTYMAVVREKLPELRHFSIGTPHKDFANRSTVQVFLAATRQISDMCNCAKCKPRTNSSPSTWCLLLTMYTIIFLTHLMERCSLHSDLRPKRFGIFSLYMALQDQQTAFVGGVNDSLAEMTFRSFFAVNSPGGLFTSYIVLFDGARFRHCCGPAGLPFQTATASAYSTRGVYCFLGSLAGLSMDYNRSAMVHVGSGVIECRSRLREWVFDRHEGVAPSTDPGYPPEEISQTTELSALQADLSSPSLTVEAVVEDTLHLVFYYRISSPRGWVFISPANFAVYTLGPIAEIAAGPNGLSGHTPNPATPVKDLTYSVARGEGKVANSQTGVILRPHKGNLLAQCIAASWFPQRTVFVTSDEELSRALGWYAESRANGGNRWNDPNFFIISG